MRKLERTTNTFEHFGQKALRLCVCACVRACVRVCACVCVSRCLQGVESGNKLPWRSLAGAFDGQAHQKRPRKERRHDEPLDRCRASAEGNEIYHLSFTLPAVSNSVRGNNNFPEWENTASCFNEAIASQRQHSMRNLIILRRHFGRCAASVHTIFLR